MTFTALNAWTPHDDAKLIEMWNRGDSAGMIAVALRKVSRSAVIGRVYRLRKAGADLRSSPPQSTRPDRLPSIKRNRSTANGAQNRVKAKARDHAPGRFVLVPMNRTSEPQPPKVTVDATAFSPLPDSTPVPFLSRKWGECAWHVGGEPGPDMLCCGLPAPDRDGPRFCAAHREASRNKTARPKSMKDLLRLARAA